jgi:integrase
LLGIQGVKGKITLKSVNAMPPIGDAFLWDTTVSGFGVKRTGAGDRIYLLQYRMAGRGSKTTRYTIGKHGSPWTPDAARQEARAILRKIAAGIDPNQEKRVTRRVPATTEVTALFAEFIERHHKAKGNRYWPEHQRNFDHDVKPHWQGRSIKSIMRRDVLDVLDRIAARGATVQANRTRTTLSKFFNWCVDRDLIDTSPASRVPKIDGERARDRALSDDEIRLFWKGCDELGWPFGPLCKMLLLTAQRRDEVGTMEWSEIDFRERLWTIPREKAKNDRTHEVHLSAMAVEILDGLPKIGEEPRFVFTTTERRPVSGFSKAKTRLDQAMLEQSRADLQIGGKDPDKAKLEDWIFHDLRRTATTGMARLNVAPHVVDRILNHVSGAIRGVAAVYNRHAYLDERKAALEAWGRYVETLVRPLPANVFPITAVR